jgi:hypothetical protein
MPVPDVIALSDYWTENPPVHLLHKWYVGYKGKGKSRRGELNKHERAALPSQSQVLPAAAVPLYVQEAMRAHKEKLDAR